MSKFAEADMARMRNTFIEKLKALPVKPDGHPDIGTVEDAEALANKWSGEIMESREGMLERLLAFLKTDNGYGKGE